ncbi:MAG: hypothetical protein HC878_00270 [Leptolyngbyaceae cyanobacterium SL_5_14]|nr:hypothetical protein [Leptolyngbyaceae cyanobacterium SL_5_14]
MSLKSTESALLIAGLALIAVATHKHISNDNYDPLPLIAKGVGIITLGKLAPTEKLDEKLIGKIPDKDL